MTEQRFSKVFWMIYGAAQKKPRYISHRGGTRSGKTYSTLQFLNLLIPKADKAGDISSVVSESLPHLKRGAIRDFESIIGHPLKDDPNWNATDLVYTYPNGAKLEFFSVDSSDKVLGPARKRLFENECNHIAYATHRQLAVRTTGIIFMDYNPASLFWAIEKVETKSNCECLKTTYRDNKEFLSDEQIREIEDNKDDPNWWKVYGDGEIGTLDGLIYQFTLIDQMPPKGMGKPEADKTDEELWADTLDEIQGLDFGFTNDPTARVQVYADRKRKELYIRQRCYRTHMKNKDIVQDLLLDGVGPNVEIYADCAEPKSIAEIEEKNEVNPKGFKIIKCDKDAPVKSDKLKFQLLWMSGWKMFVTKDSLDLINELRNYSWMKDKDGKPTNEPIDKFNHALDALRYAVWTKYGRDSNVGVYTLGFKQRMNRR